MRLSLLAFNFPPLIFITIFYFTLFPEVLATPVPSPAPMLSPMQADEGVGEAFRLVRRAGSCTHKEAMSEFLLSSFYGGGFLIIFLYKSVLLLSELQASLVRGSSQSYFRKMVRSFFPNRK